MSSNQPKSTKGIPGLKQRYVTIETAQQLDEIKAYTMLRPHEILAPLVARLAEEMDRAKKDKKPEKFFDEWITQLIARMVSVK